MEKEKNITNLKFIVIIQGNTEVFHIPYEILNIVYLKKVL